MSDEKINAVVEAARAWRETRHVEGMARHGDYEERTLMDALSALDETPEARVVRCAREYAEIYGGTIVNSGKALDLLEAVRALPPAEQ